MLSPDKSDTDAGYPFMFMGSDKKPAETIPDYSKPSSGYTQSYNNISDIILDESYINNPPILPTGFEKNPRKEWLYNFSINLSKTSLIRYSNNKFYSYNGSYHEPYNFDTFNGIISRLLLDTGIYPTAGDVRFVADNLKVLAASMPYTIPANNPDYWLFANGIVNVKTGKLHPITPDYFATGAIAANYSPNLANCHPVLDEFLYTGTGGDMVLIQRLWEFLAYAISPDYRLRVIFCLIGVGGAGKSVYLKLIQMLLTLSLVINMSMSNLANKPFAESELENKRVCIASDEGNFNFNEESAARLKRISGGGETITADVKMKAQTTFMTTAKLLIASNYPIHRSAAIIDPYLRSRMVILPFTHSIPIEKQDPDLINKLISERDAIATKAFYVYKQLMQKNFIFAGDEAYYENLANIATASTSHGTMRIFSEDFCNFDGISFTHTEKLLKAYNTAFPNVQFKDASAFSRAFLEANYDKIEPKRKHTSESNLRGFIGVSLKGE
ncbi:MAG: phage/plasmid primase, P4 family [Porcipelethomonas sp.]